METHNPSTVSHASFLKEMEAASHQPIAACYQCGNCTAGCPAAFAYDMQAHQVMRAIQSNQRERVLHSDSLSLCLGCSTCSQRCPNNIDVAAIMEHLRHKAAAEGATGIARVPKFWRSFLATVRRCGRTYELGTMVLYMLRSGRVFTDVDLAPQALWRGKLPLKPHAISGADAVGRIFRRYEKRLEYRLEQQSTPGQEPTPAAKIAAAWANLRTLRTLPKLPKFPALPKFPVLPKFSLKKKSADAADREG